MDADFLWNRIGNSPKIFRGFGGMLLEFEGCTRSPLSIGCFREMFGKPFSSLEIAPLPKPGGWRLDTAMGNNRTFCIPFALCGTCSATQFRWIQKGEETEKQSWAIDHVYIGEACPKLCSGHGYCTTGAVCICDESFQGLNPRPSLAQETVGVAFLSTWVQRPLGNGWELQLRDLRWTIPQRYLE